MTLQGFVGKWKLSFENADVMFESIALVGRVGCGIYTNTADMGADLSGTDGYDFEEDDKRNPTCLTGNAGDNVGDTERIGADLFGSFAEAKCVALILVSIGSQTIHLHSAPCHFTGVEFVCQATVLLFESSHVSGAFVNWDVFKLRR